MTGGAGAIGSHVVDALLARGVEVAVLDSFDPFYPRAAKEQNLAHAREHAGFRGVYEADIRDVAAVRRAMRDIKPEVVFHLAARAGVRPSVEAPVLYADVNVTGTAVVVSEAAACGATRLVFASSSTVYGEGAASPFVEGGDTGRPVSPYGASKRSGELLCHALHLTTGIAITCARLFSAYGPRQRPDLAIACWAEAMLAGRPIPVLGDGTVERDFTYVDDVVAGLLQAADRASSFHLYNIGRGQPASMNRVIELLERELGVPAKRDVRPAHPADLPRTCASIERACEELGYAPSVELHDGIRRYVAWLRSRA